MAYLDIDLLGPIKSAFLVNTKARNLLLNIVGKWPTAGYEHTESKAELEEGVFLGLAIDEDNQFDQTEERVAAWVEQIKKEFPL